MVRRPHDPDYLRQLVDDVNAFRAAFEGWMKLHTPLMGFGGALAPAVALRENVSDHAVDEAADVVSRRAGRIGEVARLTGATMVVQGAGSIDPFVNWQAIVRPKPLLEPRDIRGQCEFALGRLEGMIRKANAQAPPEIGVDSMHPLVWGAAAGLWHDGYRRLAVEAAATAVIGQVKTRTGRTNDQDTPVLQQVFVNEDPKPGQPRLRWPGNPDDRTVKSIRDGLARYAPGVNLLVRNTATHVDVELDEQDALERLCVYSLLARHIEGCVLEQHPDDLLGSASP